MPDRSKVGVRRIVVPGSPDWGLGEGLTALTPEKSTATKPPEPMEEDHGGGQDPHRVVAPTKKKKQL
jgi:hypothetical protein